MEGHNPHANVHVALFLFGEPYHRRVFVFIIWVGVATAAAAALAASASYTVNGRSAAAAITAASDCI